MTERRVLHCWADGPSLLEWIEAGKDVNDHISSTCMLERGHEGPHEFTPDDQIIIAFSGGERDSQSDTK